MARDLNRLMQDVQNAREVFVTEDGHIEDAAEAQANAAREEATEGAPKPRTRLKPEVFGGEERTVVVHAGVVDAMHEEATRHPGETGGIVVGPEPGVVTELIASGPGARRTSASYELDVVHLQPLLEAAEGRGLQFLGVWHSHPEGHSELSGTDRKAARSILGDSEWGVTELLLPLSVRTGGAFETQFFLAEGREPRVRPVRPILSSAGRARLAATPENAHPGPWALAGSFTDTPYGRSRLKEDCDALAAAGWKVAVKRREGIALIAEHEEIAVFFLLPREYPFGAPDVFRTRDGRLAEVRGADLPEFVPWSSRRSLVELAEAVKALATTTTPAFRLRRPPVRSLVRAALRRGARLVAAF
jgi:integrative and conjugative element protein (TIGR02256 family)